MNQSMNESIEIEKPEITVQIFRFKFSNEFTEQMANFAKIHQFDDRKSFKEAWEKWILDEDIHSLINTEQKRLFNNGYEGDVLDKMFKSARYYYRKKKETADTAQRKEYIGSSTQLIELMDKHIRTKFLENTRKNSNNKIVTNISPANAYIDFCNTYYQEIAGEQTVDCTESSQQDVDNKKLKKTYKNRYFIQSRSLYP
jgi:hypothetical protein